MNQMTTTIISALAEPRRLRIVELLAAEGEMNASDIAGRFEITPAAISQHLRLLREARVVTMHKQAQQRLYRINPEALSELEQWSHRMRTTWSARFDQLDELLNPHDTH